MAATRRRKLAVLGASLALVGAGVGIAAVLISRSSPPRQSEAALEYAHEVALATGATKALADAPPSREGALAPAGPAVFRRPLPSHQVFAFVPYWELPLPAALDLADLTTISWFSLDLGSDGTLVESGPGWASLTGARFAALAADAHASGDEVLLTVADSTVSRINALVSRPAASAERLVAGLVPLLQRYHFDGVDLDIEGSGTTGRARFVTFVSRVGRALRRADPGSRLVVDTYATSAGDPGSFFDVRRLAPLVDSLFVMAYEMQDPDYASANAPLVSLGANDAGTLLAYTAAVPAAKLILGVPFYGIDFPTVGKSPGAPARGSTVAVTYAAVRAKDPPARWDPQSETPYVVFSRGGGWHQTWFENPTSIGLKSALAAHFHLAGVGVWTLGMAGGDVAMVAALLGGSPPRKLPVVAAETAAGLRSPRNSR